ncbi:MAG: four helix bundle protein [Bacteroidales bacterium]|nr:four helix bundle protein [Bacteroidales bacterium]
MCLHSVSCNLAAGCARKTPKEQLRFYEIPFGSAAEVVNLLILCNDFELLSDDDYQELRTDVEKITFQINNLSKGIS